MTSIVLYTLVFLAVARDADLSFIPYAFLVANFMCFVIRAQVRLHTCLSFPLCIKPLIGRLRECCASAGRAVVEPQLSINH